MAHFYGKMDGPRASVTRSGGKNDVVSAQLGGWHIGGRVEVMQSPLTGRDTVSFRFASSSTGQCIGGHVRAVRCESGEVEVIPSGEFVKALHLPTLLSLVNADDELRRAFVAALFVSGKATEQLTEAA